MPLFQTLNYCTKRIFCNTQKIRAILTFFECETFVSVNLKMSTSSESKYNWSMSLICPNGNHDPIRLPHQEALFVGRCPATRIVDPRCSRKQMKIFADLLTGEIQVTQTGSNSSVLDGMEMIQDKVYNMTHSSTLHILAGLYPQKLEVKQLDTGTTWSSTETKHKHSNKKNIHTSDEKSIDQCMMKNKKSAVNNHSFDEEKLKEPSKSDKKSSSKRKSSDDISDKTSKRPKLQETERKKSETESESKSKPKNKHDHEAKVSHSKQKENGDVKVTDRKVEKTSSKDLGDDSEYMKKVAEKLKQMKSSALKLNTPEKATGSTSKTQKAKETSSQGFESASTSSIPSNSPASSSRWDAFDSLHVYTSKGLTGRGKIAGFDIDGTIIETQSGKKFPKDPGDWRMKFSNQVVKKIRKLYEEDYKIVFFTNQMGVSRGQTKIADLKTKFADVLEEIDVPIQIFVSTKLGLYRKPCPGMWDFLLNKGNNDVPVELSQSFYVGDAAGRPDNWAPKKKKDFSCSDRLFALNIGLEFRTPEEFFLGYPTSKFQLPQFDPRTVSSKTPLLEPADAQLTSSHKEVIVLAGSPAAGKSYFSTKYLVPEGYVRVNRDTLGTWQKCVTACKDNLKKGNSVVVDNTNPDVESRARYLKVASSLGVPCRCFVFTTTLDQAKHNERFRGITDPSHEGINDIVMNSFKGKYRPPDISEGFSEIVKVNFVPKFKDKKQKELYKMFLMEK